MFGLFRAVIIFRDVAQLVSVPALGAGGSEFESQHPDMSSTMLVEGFFVLR